MKRRAINFLSFGNKFSHFIGDAEPNPAKEIITGVLTTLYKAGQVTIDELTADGVKPEVVLSKLAELDKERVKNLTTATETKSFQDGYKKAKKEVLTEAEAAKKEAHGITSDLTGVELDNFIIAEKLKEAGAKSDDEIRKTPTYQALEAKYKKDLKLANDQMEAKVKELEAGFAKEQTFTTVGKSAIDILTGLNAILPTNPTVAETQKRDFLNELKAGYNYELGADGKVLVSTKEGELLKDEHGHTLSYEDHVKKIATNRFEFAQNNGGSNSGADPKPPTGKDSPAAYPPGIAKPKNSSELAAVLKTLVVPDGADEKAKKAIIAQKRVVIETFQKENPGQ